MSEITLSRSEAMVVTSNLHELRNLPAPGTEWGWGEVTGDDDGDVAERVLRRLGDVAVERVDAGRYRTRRRFAEYLEEKHRIELDIRGQSTLPGVEDMNTGTDEGFDRRAVRADGGTASVTVRSNTAEQVTLIGGPAITRPHDDGTGTFGADLTEREAQARSLPPWVRARHDDQQTRLNEFAGTDDREARAQPVTGDVHDALDDQDDLQERGD